jgi:hypothetical protein
VAAATRGRWYVARVSDLPPGAAELPCTVCGGTYDIVDMATCPHHGGTICSLCCSTEGACHDVCKPSAWRPIGPVMLGLPDPAPAAAAIGLDTQPSTEVA